MVPPHFPLVFFKIIKLKKKYYKHKKLVVKLYNPIGGLDRIGLFYNQSNNIYTNHFSQFFIKKNRESTANI